MRQYKLTLAYGHGGKPIQFYNLAEVADLQMFPNYWLETLVDLPVGGTWIDTDGDVWERVA